jgi:hypothetical protein
MGRAKMQDAVEMHVDEWAEVVERLNEVIRSNIHFRTGHPPSKEAQRRTKGTGVGKESESVSQRRRQREGGGSFPQLWRVQDEAQEMWGDRDPATGNRFPTILAMRAAKLREWFWYAKHQMSFSSQIACRDFLLDPEKILARLRDDFDLTPIDPNKWDLSQCILEHGVQWCSNVPNSGGLQTWNNEMQVKKREHYLNGEYLKTIDPDSFDVINAWIDSGLEGALGYKTMDSLTDARTPFNEDTRCGMHLAPSNYSGLGSCSPAHAANTSARRFILES